MGSLVSQTAGEVSTPPPPLFKTIFQGYLVLRDQAQVSYPRSLAGKLTLGGISAYHLLLGFWALGSSTCAICTLLNYLPCPPDHFVS